MILALAGGIGGAKLLLGLARAIPVDEITIIGNTGDDIELLGLRICPDLDTITYTLTGKVNPETGWGVLADTFSCLDCLVKFGGPSWFKLGDQDLATHLWRTSLLRQGTSLTEVTQQIAGSLGLRCRLLPMTESYTPTFVSTNQGVLHLQEYLVREQARPRLYEIRHQNVEQCSPAPGVIEAIEQAETIVICPSNPFISIGPILSVPGIRSALLRSQGLVVAVTPIIKGRAVKGPAAKMLQDLGFPLTATSVARLYSDFIDVFVLDEQDANLRAEIEALGIRVLLTNTLMNTLADKERLAHLVLQAI